LQCNKTEALDDIKKDLIARDHQDSNRALAPLTQAPDAIVVDTSNRSFKENVDEIIHLFHLKEAAHA
jgi:cytidylate kinase